MAKCALSSGTVPVHRSDLLRAVIYPDSDDYATSTALDNGPDTAYDRVEHQYNTQGQQVRVKDQNGTIHDYLFDLLGRETADIARELGTNADDSVLRMPPSRRTNSAMFSWVRLTRMPGERVI